ncbi:MAG: 50S ribosomal protein L4 [Candidatus Nomurabacteria bacterium]|jgi:large subunit ribosomal protein L4|nr:50S ribosomal protein L4 [Candidatus Nomurabacteria bacterium]
MADVKLNKDIFGLEVKNHELLKLAYTAYLANSRSAAAKTLKRGEVRGGGKKPWRQKGTGRARFGSTRNPIWRHGGVAFGPTGEQNFKIKLTKNMKRGAVVQALSLANQAKKIFIGADFAPAEGKVKETFAYRDDLVKTAGYKPLQRGCRVLLVVPEKSDLILRATRNIPELKVVRPTYLNVFDILNADAVVITKSALPLIEEWLGVKEEK